MPTMTIKNVSGKDAYFGYGDASVESTGSFGTSGIAPSFYLVNGASQANLPYALAANYQFQQDLDNGLIEVTAGSPLITLRNTAAVYTYFGYLPPTFPVAAAAEGPLMCQDSGLPGVKGLAYEISAANGPSPLNRDIAASRTALDGVVITLSAVTNGTISPAAGAHAINAGVDYPITMTPATGYHVGVVLDNSVSKPTTSPYTIHSAVIDHTVAVTFTINSYAVTFALAGGARTGGGALTQTINHGSMAVVPTYTPPSGYRIADVPWSPVLAAVTAIVTYTALYTRFWVVTAAAGTHGSVDTATQNVDNGTDSTNILATADAHYHFTAWSGSYVGATNPYKFVNVLAAKAITAAFAIDTYTLTYSAGANGSIVGTNPQTINWNASGTEVVATPSAHYHWVSWSDGALAAARTDNPVVANITASAAFAIDTYAITFALDGGTRTGGGALSQTVDWNVVPTLPTYTAPAGKRIADIPWSPVVAAATAIQTYTALYTVVWTLTMTATGNGTVTPAKGPVDTGVATPIEAINGTGTFDHWVATGGAVILDVNDPTTTVTLSAAGGAEAVFVGP